MASAYFQQMLAIIAAAAGAGGAPYAFRTTNIGVHMISRSGSATSTATSALGGGAATVGGYVTGHLCLKVPAHFDEVALVFANPSSTAFQIAGASVAAGATMNDLTNSSASGRDTFKRVTKGGANSWTMVAGTDNLAGYTVTDFIPCPSVNRAAGDQAAWSVAGGKLADAYEEPLLHIRVAFPVSAVDQAAANASVVPGPTNSPLSHANWPIAPVQPSVTGRFQACAWSTAATDQLSIGSAAALSGTVYGPYNSGIRCPVAAVIFKCRGNVVTVAACGDSITNGAGLTSTSGGLPWSLYAADKSSTLAQPVFYMHLGRDGMNSGTYLGYINQCIAAGMVPTHCVFPVGTPNDGGIAPANNAAFFALRQSQQINTVAWTMLPVGQVAPQKYTNPSTELTRIATNDAVRNGTITSGQYEWMEMELPDLTDNATPYASIPSPLSDALRLHPNNAGDLLMRATFSTKLADLKAKYFA